MGHIPDSYHVVVHLLEFLLGGLEGVGRGIELVGLKGLIGELDGEGRLIVLEKQCQERLSSSAVQRGAHIRHVVLFSMGACGVGGDGPPSGDIGLASRGGSKAEAAQTGSRHHLERSKSRTTKVKGRPEGQEAEVQNEMRTWLRAARGASRRSTADPKQLRRPNFPMKMAVAPTLTLTPGGSSCSGVQVPLAQYVSDAVAIEG